jgi:hypothetical protein
MSSSLFNFISDEDFRKTLESDLIEAERCFESQAWKAVHVLSGSLVETVLIYYLVSQELIDKQSALSLDLGKAIDKCKNSNIITITTADLCSVIRAYRNLIHPGRKIRLKEEVTAETAQVALSVVRIIVSEVSKKKLENYGYTAEQIAAKIEKDSSAEAIISHLLKETKPLELERLMMSILPKHYLRAWEDDETPPHVLGALISCFRSSFNQADDTTKKKVTKQFVSILKEGEERDVMSYGTAFFRGHDLNYLTEPDATLVSDHLLSRLKNSPSAQVLDAIVGLSAHLTKTDVSTFVDGLVRIATSRKDISQKARYTLEGEFLHTNSATDKLILSRLTLWENTFENRQDTANSKLIAQVKTSYDDVPF